VRRSGSPFNPARVIVKQWSMYGTYSEFVFGEYAVGQKLRVFQ
jgi:hypothetical protein